MLGLKTYITTSDYLMYFETMSHVTQTALELEMYPTIHLELRILVPQSLQRWDYTLCFEFSANLQTKSTTEIIIKLFCVL